MLRTYWVTGMVIALAVVATPARADHDRELGYILGGAIVGAAIGGIVYDSHRHARHSHRHADAHYHYAPVRYYAPVHGVRHNRGHRRHIRGRHYGNRYSVGYRHARHRH